MDEIAVFSHLTTILTTKKDLRKHVRAGKKKAKSPQFLAFQELRAPFKSGGGGIRTHGPC